MKEYRSPFLLPPKCNNPKYANRYPRTHSEACDAHKPQEKEWQAWAVYREAFATLEINPFDKESVRRENYFLDKMLSTVTATNPPEAPFEQEIGMETETTEGLTIEEALTKAWNKVRTIPVPVLAFVGIVWVIIFVDIAGII